MAASTLSERDFDLCCQFLTAPSSQVLSPEQQALLARVYGGVEQQQITVELGLQLSDCKLTERMLTSLQRMLERVQAADRDNPLRFPVKFTITTLYFGMTAFANALQHGDYEGFGFDVRHLGAEFAHQPMRYASRPIGARFGRFPVVRAAGTVYADSRCQLARAYPPALWQHLLNASGHGPHPRSVVHAALYAGPQNPRAGGQRDVGLDRVWACVLAPAYGIAWLSTRSIVTEHEKPSAILPGGETRSSSSIKTLTWSAACHEDIMLLLQLIGHSLEALTLKGEYSSSERLELILNWCSNLKHFASDGNDSACVLLLLKACQDGRCQIEHLAIS